MKKIDMKHCNDIPATCSPTCPVIKICPYNNRDKK